MLSLFFCFRQQTAYELLISDWGSDVCSSDLLANPTHLGGAAEEARQLWRWHAIEEIEHKAVAFDTYLHAARSMTPLRRWLKRSTVMCVTTMRFQDRKSTRLNSSH